MIPVGAALVLSSSAVRHLSVLQSTVRRLGSRLILGITLIMTGSTLSGLVMSFMRQGRTSV